VTYTALLRIPEFRSLYAAQALSLGGDQVARIAVALLVFQRTHSPLLTAVSYATTYATWLLAGPLLATLADSLPRRRLMIACDLLRAGLVLGMVAAAGTLWIMFVLLACVTILDAPFQSARAALLPSVVAGEQYTMALSLASITNQVAQVAGFGAGGIIVGAVTVRGALGIDAVTFLASALLVRAGVHWQAAALSGPRRMLGSAGEVLRLLWRSPLLRSLLALTWFSAALAVVPEGLAVVYAHRHGAGPVGAGLLTAALPAGQVVGAVLFVRFGTDRLRKLLLLPLAVLCFAPLVATLADPGLVVTYLLWAACGAGASLSVITYQLFTTAVPDEVRGRAYGIASTGLLAGQGIALVVSGALAERSSVHAVVGWAGLIGLACTAMLAIVWPRRAIAEIGWDSSSPGTAATKTTEITQEVAR